MAAVGAEAFNAFQFAAADTVGEVPAEVTQTLSVLYSSFFFPFTAGIMLALVAAGIAIVRHGALPGWVGYAAIVLAILMFTPAFFVGLLGTGLWILVVSVLLYTGDSEPAPAAPPAAAP